MVVVGHGVVVVGQYGLVGRGEVGAGVVAGGELGEGPWVAHAEVGMKSEEVEYVEGVGVPRAARCAPVVDECEVVLVGECVALVEHQAARMGIVEEGILYEVAEAGTARDVLVAEERHVVARLSVQQREGRLLRPRASRPRAVCGKHVLERLAGGVPRAYHVGVGHELAAAPPPELARRGGLGVAVERAVAPVVALAYDEHHVRREVRGGVYVCPEHAPLKLRYLSAQTVRLAQRERQPVHRQVEVGALREVPYLLRLQFAVLAHHAA